MIKLSHTYLLVLVGLIGFTTACSNKEGIPPPVPVIKNPVFTDAIINGVSLDNIVYDVNLQPVIKINFTEALKQTTVTGSVTLSDANGSSVAIATTLENSDKSIVVQPLAPVNYLRKYFINVGTTLRSVSDGQLQSQVSKSFITKIDSSRKFPPISDNALLDLVQQQTFKYFWEFGHPVSGLARERNTSGDVVTSGGSGFGIMTIPVAINRGFITRFQGLARMQTIVAFLKNTAVKIKGAFPHWLNGNTGAIVPFSVNDNGADLVETSYLMMGLLTARQYFNGADMSETTLRSDINTLYNNVEWNWFRQGGQNVLYWHYSTDKGWIMNHKIQGWNECLVTYVLAAASTTHGIPAAVYTNGWAGNGSNGFINTSTYYGYNLPLGPELGGPLFFSHYSFMGINPNGLSDTYADYTIQTKNHTLINYNYCKSNPKRWFGYSDSCWGLTASDILNGYTASSPTNDVGVIAPTAAISSFPYTPVESMKALKFFYYVLGDRIWQQYGFVDAFSLKGLWYSDSFLAIDQGPEIVMIENYRTGLLWNLFTSCPEVKAGMRLLGFSAPYL
jgi:hypothetical protein